MMIGRETMRGAYSVYGVSGGSRNLPWQVHLYLADGGWGARSQSLSQGFKGAVSEQVMMRVVIVGLYYKSKIVGLTPDSGIESQNSAVLSPGRDGQEETHTHRNEMRHM